MQSWTFLLSSGPAFFHSTLWPHRNFCRFYQYVKFVVTDLHARGEDNMTPLHLVAKYKPKKEKLYGAGDGVRFYFLNELEQ